MALEWLKTILGDAYTDEIEKKVSEEIGKGFVAKADFNAKNEALKELEGQIKERDEQLASLKKVDAEGLQKEIERLQSENKTATENYVSKIKQLELDSALDLALLTGKARDPKAVKPFLDLGTVKLEDGKLSGLEEQLKSLREEKGFLFDIQEENNSGATVDSGSEHGGGGGSIDSFIASARKAAGLPDAETKE